MIGDIMALDWPAIAIVAAIILVVFALGYATVGSPDDDVFP